MEEILNENVKVTVCPPMYAEGYVDFQFDDSESVKNKGKYKLTYHIKKREIKK